MTPSANADVSVFAPDGTARGTLTGVPDVGCITPSGQYLVTPGAGLWTGAGAPVASSWGGVTAGRCVADGRGNVIVARRLSPSNWTLTKYTVKGVLKSTFSVTPLMSNFNFAIDLAPDECTVYYGAYAALGSDNMGRFDVCSGTQLANQPGAFSNDLRVLPDWTVLSVDDPAAYRHDPAGVLPWQSYFPPYRTGWLRSMALDPDERSFWVCCSSGGEHGGSGRSELFRFDLASGTLLATVPRIAPPAVGVTPRRGDLLVSGRLAGVFSPPIVGSADLAGFVDTNPAGTAQAFRARAEHDGPLSRLNLYLDASSTASQVVVGVYSERPGARPGTLLAQATITAPRAGSWNVVDVPPVAIAAGTRYWIAVLAPAGAGAVKFRAVEGGGRSETSAQSTLASLPASWTSGTVWSTAPASVYGS